MSISPLLPPAPPLHPHCPQKNQWKPHDVPKHIYDAKPIEGFARVPSAPKDPAAVFQPFHLQSEEKHSRYQEMRARRLAEEAARAEEARVFRAQQLDKVGRAAGVGFVGRWAVGAVGRRRPRGGGWPRPRDTGPWALLSFECPRPCRLLLLKHC